MSTDRDAILSTFHKLGTLVADALVAKDARITELETDLIHMKTKLGRVSDLFRAAATELDRED